MKFPCNGLNIGKNDFLGIDLINPDMPWLFEAEEVRPFLTFSTYIQGSLNLGEDGKIYGIRRGTLPERKEYFKELYIPQSSAMKATLFTIDNPNKRGKACGLNWDEKTIGSMLFSKGLLEENGSWNLMYPLLQPNPIFVHFSYENSPCSTRFINESNPEFSNFTWYWENGESAVSGREDVYHKFKKAGEYKIRLVGITPQGYKKSFWIRVKVPYVRETLKEGIDLSCLTYKNEQWNMEWGAIKAAQEYQVYVNKKLYSTTTSPSFTFTTLQPYDKIQVIMKDSCGGESPISNTVSPHFLLGESFGREYALLSWSPLSMGEEYSIVKDETMLLSNSHDSSFKDYDYFNEENNTTCYSLIKHGNEKDCSSPKVCLDYKPTLIVPRAFTPNKDNLNDIFIPVAYGFDSYHFQVFNRWGQLVFETKDKNQGWDGKNCQQGVYIVLVKATKNNKVYEDKTVVELLR